MKKSHNGLVLLCMMSIGCVNSKSGGSLKFRDESILDPTKHDINEFNLSSDLSASRLVKTVGGPARYAGSGVTYFVYQLKDDSELWLYFVPQADNGFTNLAKATIFRRREGALIEERIVFHAK